MISKKRLQDYIEVIRGIHRDPFSILGMHVQEAAEKNIVEIRVFRPDAISVFLKDLDSEKSWGMPMIYEEGFFELTIPTREEVFAYELEIRLQNGNILRTRDPYSFLPVMTEFDRHLFLEGTNYRIYEKMGARNMIHQGVHGVLFSVWAPTARRVSVIGSFNDWDGLVHPMRVLGSSGIWEIFIPGIHAGELYKFEILTMDQKVIHKADPFGFHMQSAPETASVIYELPSFSWSDENWIHKRHKKDHKKSAMAIYEVHLGSFSRDEGGNFLNYRDLAYKIASYCRYMGYTHVELLPVCEHPFYGSWGYQVIGYYAPTSRYGSPEDLMYFVDHMHQSGIGVILDWVPAHFPKDQHGLARFDGTALYEHLDPRKGEHRDWGTLIYNYGRPEVKNFLISNLIYWAEKFHIDGFRMDAVASMLYLDYSRNHGEWIPNQYGGRENLEAVDFLRHANHILHEYYPGVITIAEESTSWPAVSKPVHVGGLGFDYKWNMGWMNDVLSFMQTDPLYRKFDMGKLTFGLYYAWSENFMLVLSHDEVVHGKRSLLNKMPGDLWSKFANLRLLLGYMIAHPGKKLIFMGADIAQQIEWNHDQGLDWHLVQYPQHRGIQTWYRDLLHLYQSSPALHRYDFQPEGFEWIDFHDTQNTVISFMRKTKNPADTLIFVFNFTPVSRHNYRVGVPFESRYHEILNSDSQFYAGSNLGNSGEIHSDRVWAQNQPYSLSLNLPPLGMLVLRPLDAPEMVEVGPDLKLLALYTMPQGIKKRIPVPKKDEKEKKSRKSKTKKDSK